jgi:hypothetical protein
MEDELVTYLCDLTGEEWRDLAARISLWRSRGAAGESTPHEILAYRPIVADDAAWSRVRRRVSSTRRKAYRQRAGEQAAEAKKQRAAYMRDYMRRYRQEGSVSDGDRGE